MNGVRYSYLDITVLPVVRDQMVSACAAIVVSPQLDAVYWANSDGIALFGTHNVRQTLENGLSVSKIVLRQMRTAIDHLKGSKTSSAMLRIQNVHTSGLIGCTFDPIELPDGEPAILIVTAPLHGRGRTIEAMAKDALSALSGYGHASALIDHDGSILGASDGFDAVNVSSDTLKQLVQEVSGEDDRLVKRPVEGTKGSYAAGIARLSDAPARHLLILADLIEAETDHSSDQAEDVSVLETSTFASNVTDAAVDASASSDASTFDQPKDDAAQDALAEARRSVGAFSSKRKPIASKGDVDRWYFKTAPAKADIKDAEEILSRERPVGRPNAPDAGLTERSELRDTDNSNDAVGTTDNASGTEPKSDGLPHISDVSNSSSTSDAGDTAPLEPVDVARNVVLNGDFEFTRGSNPVRFAWNMDANRVFRSISPEFALTVGGYSADVSDRPWTEVAAAFEIDPDGKIGDLLGKQDTWSGQSVLWPVQGTDLRVPVDLAALPSFDRDRKFEGFRGFGIVRTADAIYDPRETGKLLTNGFRGHSDMRDTSTNDNTPSERTDTDETSSRQSVDEPESQPAQTSVIEETSSNDDAIRPEQTFGKRKLGKEEMERFKRIEEGLRTTSTVPVFKPSQPPRDLESEKVVDLTKRRRTQDDRNETGASDTALPSSELSGSERKAFGKIGDTLGRSTDKEPLKKADDSTKTQDTIVIPSAFAGRTKTGANTGSTRSFGDERSELFDELPMAVIAYKGDELLFCNQTFLELTRYGSLNALAESGGIEELFDHTLPEGNGPKEDGDSQAKILRGDGKTIAVEAHLQSVKWQDGRAMLVTLREADRQKNRRKISELKEVQSSNVASIGSGSDDDKGRKAAFHDVQFNDLAAILDTATDGVVVIDENGKVRSLNRSAQALFDVESAVVSGKPFVTLLAPESRLSAEDYINGMSSNGVASVLNDGREVIGRESNGGLIPLFMTLGRLGESSGYCAVLRDITQWKKAEEDLVSARHQAEIASQQKSDFLAKISHEIRTPLNAIIGFSDLMMEERFGPIENDRYREYLRDINRSGNHVLEIVNDLLDISKIEAGKLELDFDEVELNDVVSETVALTQPQANSQRIIIRTSLSAAVPVVVADPRSIRQIILNLVSNAIKFTPSGGQVIVSTVYDESGEVVVRVRDTGVGMSEIEIASALKPFQQVNPSEAAQKAGTGLGLPLTKALVEANRARFSITSNPGQGTLVEISFPSTRVLAE